MTLTSHILTAIALCSAIWAMFASPVIGAWPAVYVICIAGGVVMVVRVVDMVRVG